MALPAQKPVISFVDVSVVDWIRSALTHPNIPPIEAVTMNGYSGRKDVTEALASLELIHRQGGADATKTAWETQVSHLIPDVAEVINRRSRLIHCSELDKIKPFSWLIHEEIPDDAVTILFGASGVGKSFQALDYAERVGRHYPVVYIIGEGKSGYKNRHAAWLKHHKHEHGKLYFYDTPINAQNPADVQAFIEDIQELKPRLVIVDTLAMCFGGGDENDTGAMSKFVDSMRRIQNTFHCAVLVIHHTGKTGTEERGNSALRAAADMMLRMDEIEGTIKLTCSKTKDSSEFEPKLLRRVTVQLDDGQSSCVILPANLVKDDREHFSLNQRAILELLADSTNERGTRTSDIKAILGLSASSFHNASSRLARLGLIKKIGMYDPWILTERGKTESRRMGFMRPNPD